MRRDVKLSVIATVIASHENALLLIAIGFALSMIVPLVSGAKWEIRVAGPLCLLWGLIGIAIFLGSDTAALDAVSTGFYVFFLPWLAAAALGAAIHRFGRRGRRAAG